MLHHIRNPHGSRACGFFAVQKRPLKNCEKGPFGIHLGYIEKMPAELIFNGLNLLFFYLSTQTLQPTLQIQ